MSRGLELIGSPISIGNGINPAIVENSQGDIIVAYNTLPNIEDNGWLGDIKLYQYDVNNNEDKRALKGMEVEFFPGQLTLIRLVRVRTKQ